MNDPTTRRLGVLISGRGSNLQAIIEAIAEQRLDAAIAVVISNREDAKGLARAREAGIETLVLSHAGYARRADYDRLLVKELKQRGVRLVCLAGFMRLLGQEFVDAFPNAVLNIHPSLLPAFPGTDAQRQALEHGVQVSGATVHFVTAELDGGPVVLQSKVPILPGDTEATLSARVQGTEHNIYPRVIGMVADGRLAWDEGRARLDGEILDVPLVEEYPSANARH